MLIIIQLRSDFDNVLSEFDKIEEECNNKIKEEHEAYQSKLEKFIKEIENIKLERDDFENRLDDVMNEKNLYKKDIFSLKDKISYLKNDKIRLEKEVEKLNDIRNIQGLEESLREVSI